MTHTKETRRKLSEAMKKRWAIRRMRENSSQRMSELANGAKPSLTNLFSAAVMLSTDDGEKLKRAICDCAKGETIVAALEAETAEGSNLQSRMRKQLSTFIQNAL